MRTPSALVDRIKGFAIRSALVGAAAAVAYAAANVSGVADAQTTAIIVAILGYAAQIIQVLQAKYPPETKFHV